MWTLLHKLKQSVEKEDYLEPLSAFCFESGFSLGSDF